MTDGDRDRPRDVIYFLTGPGVDTDEPSSAQFAINSTTGEIYVLKVSPCQRYTDITLLYSVDNFNKAGTVTKILLVMF